MSHMSFRIVAAAAVFAVAAVGHAAPLAYEGFSFPVDSSIHQKTNGTSSSGWTQTSWTSGGLSNSALVTQAAGGLSYGLLETSPGAVSDTSATASSGLMRQYQAAATPDSQVWTRWFSVLVNISSVPDNQGTILGIGLGPTWKNPGQKGTGLVLTWNASESAYRLGLSLDDTVLTPAHNSAPVSSGLAQNAPIGSTMLLVGRLTNNGTGQDLLEAWLNPPVASLGGADLVGLSGAAGYIGTTNLFAGGGQVGNARALIDVDVNSFQGTFDEFRVGLTYADVTPVVPEPAVIGLFGLATCLLVGRRRRA
jgi:hypothetical protein